MYIPPDFAEERVPVLHGLIRAHPLAALVTLTADGLVANHIPMLIGSADGSLGTLVGHVSRANPVWQAIRPDVEALAIFQGREHYITPAWYPTKQATGKVVPTWNYAVVHARGPLSVIHDRAWLRALVERLTDTHEAGRPDPWHVTDAPGDFIERQLGGIVGLELVITRLEGKWKVSQNRSAEDRAGVTRGLRAAGGPASLAMAELVDDAGRKAADGEPPPRGG
jgi:transcriptional regulator